MHIPADNIFNHRQKDKCNKVTERGLQRRDVETEARFWEMDFSLEGGEGDERVDNMMTSRYLQRPLDQTDDDWTAVRWNIMRARLV